MIILIINIGLCVISFKSETINTFIDGWIWAVNTLIIIESIIKIWVKKRNLKVARRNHQVLRDLAEELEIDLEEK